MPAREKVDTRPERPLGDLGGPTSSADARRREVRTQVRGRAGISGEMIHAGGSDPEAVCPGLPRERVRIRRSQAKDVVHPGP